MSHQTPPLPTLHKESPAPATSTSWWVEMAGKSVGPFNLPEVKSLIARNQLSASSLVVADGQSDWVELRSIAILARELLVEPYSQSPTSITINTSNSGDARSLPIIGDAADKSAGLAAVLSLVWVGLGQLYNGDFGKGILMFCLCVALWLVFLGWIVNIWSIIDAYSSAKRKRENYMRLMSGRN